MFSTLREISRGHLSTTPPPYPPAAPHLHRPTSPSPPNPHSPTHEQVSAFLLPWDLRLSIYTHGAGLVILFRNGDARVKNRSDAPIFAKSRSTVSNLRRSYLGEFRRSEDAHKCEHIYSARSTKNTLIFAHLPLARHRSAKVGSGTGRP